MLDAVAILREGIEARDTAITGLIALTRDLQGQTGEGFEDESAAREYCEAAVEAVEETR